MRIIVNKIISTPPQDSLPFEWGGGNGILVRYSGLQDIPFSQRDALYDLHEAVYVRGLGIGKTRNRWEFDLVGPKDLPAERREFWVLYSTDQILGYSIVTAPLESGPLRVSKIQERTLRPDISNKHVLFQIYNQPLMAWYSQRGVSLWIEILEGIRTTTVMTAWHQELGFGHPSLDAMRPILDAYQRRYESLEIDGSGHCIIKRKLFYRDTIDSFINLIRRA